MSRIGKAPVLFPEAVAITVDADNKVLVKGPKGELALSVDRDIKVSVKGNQADFERPTDQKRHRSLHGLYRALVSNMVDGVVNGYKLQLELVGVGYKASISNNVLELSLGYSHVIYFVRQKYEI